MDFRRPLRVVTPTLDADVLGVLARADVEMSGREIQRLAGHGSHQGIRNAADRLTQQGIVLRRAAGGAHLYRLNRDHLAARLIEEMGDLTSQFVQRLRMTIGAWTIAPTAAVLFGSVPTGGAADTSDIDLLIIRASSCDPDSPQWQAQLLQLEGAGHILDRQRRPHHRVRRERSREWKSRRCRSRGAPERHPALLVRRSRWSSHSATSGITPLPPPPPSLDSDRVREEAERARARSEQRA